MKVLQNSRYYLQWEYKAICASCQSTLAVEAHDLSYYGYESQEVDDRYYPGYEEYTCKCSVCNGTVIIPSSEVWRSVKILAKNKKGK